MSRRSIKSTINKHLKRITARCHRITISFLPDDIHDLRVEVKKLRAFLRLVQSAGHANGQDLRLPAHIKAVYRAAGEMRDIQLQLERIANQEGLDVPHYRALLKTILHDLERQFAAVLLFQKEGNPPEKPETPMPHLRRFILAKMSTALALIHAGTTDENLHGVRKSLKDISYNLKKPGRAQESLPAVFNTKAGRSEIGSLSDDLGAFNDWCNALALLGPGFVQHLPDGEQQRLGELAQQWTAEKEKLREKVLQKLGVLQWSFAVTGEAP